MESLLKEGRVFDPPAAFRAQANVGADLYDEAAKDRLAYWGRQAEQLDWFRKWDRVLEWNPPFAQWFVGGKLNACYNCVDRHAAGGRADKPAIIWEGEPGDSATLTYADLLREVTRFAAVLKQLGVNQGDRVAIYMPIIPQTVVAMLACARIGAAHSVVFAGFSPEALAFRINDSGAKVLITADGYWRRGQLLSTKQNANVAVESCPSIETVLVVQRAGNDVAEGWVDGRDRWYHEEALSATGDVPCAELDAEDPLYVLYTSGSTGKPKGALHTIGGYLTHVASTHRAVFDTKESDVFWCTADIAWTTAHSYVVYGPLANGTTIFLYEGAPETPHRGRWWELIAKYRINVLYTAPTAIRTFMKWGAVEPAEFDLTSLRLLGSVGEPINPEAWIWYQTHIGGGRCPIVDTWWQTETGGMMVAPLPGVTPTKPGSATRPLPGIDVAVVDEDGNPVTRGGGYLVVKSPWPGMLRTVWGDDQRYASTYFSKFGPETYFAGDGARLDEDGYLWFLGRVDDVVNVSGHRIGTTEVESALVGHPAVAEAAVIGREHEVKGQAITAFVVLREGNEPSAALEKELKAHVTREIGGLARPEEVRFAPELPKNRAGKILRRLLRDIAEGRELGDTTTLIDPTVVAVLQSHK
ncbi:MAG: Acetyl-coenzyme synthetase [Firmicutes bacterium]|nr:Acetyl-coenzyme synthetase [Bacillota bacterium]